MPAFWYQPRATPASLMLAPLAALYGLVARTHAKWRRRNVYYAGVPVISVGNIVVGGSGKTPVVRWLAEHFASRGQQVAIVSRGYGGTETARPTRVDATHTGGHTAAQVGDEPLMLARQLAHLPVTVWVGKNRPAVVRRAEQAGATLILLDDGFQRHDVARTADVVVIDGSVAFGNGKLLPAGPLREPVTSLERAHAAIIINPPEGQPAYVGTRAYRLTTHADAKTLADLRGKPVVAFAGLAHPAKLFGTLKQAGITTAAEVSYPDHHAYTADDITDLNELAAKHKAVLVTTAKDAVKLPAGFAHVLDITLEGPDKTEILRTITERF